MLGGPLLSSVTARTFVLRAIGGQACSLRQIFADQLAKLASGLRTEVSLRKNLDHATSHED
jgi:hypothetical protein